MLASRARRTAYQPSLAPASALPVLASSPSSIGRKLAPTSRNLSNVATLSPAPWSPCRSRSQDSLQQIAVVNSRRISASWVLSGGSADDGAAADNLQDPAGR